MLSQADATLPTAYGREYQVELESPELFTSTEHLAGSLSENQLPSKVTNMLWDRRKGQTTSMLIAATTICPSQACRKAAMPTRASLIVMASHCHQPCGGSALHTSTPTAVEAQSQQEGVHSPHSRHSGVPDFGDQEHCITGYRMSCTHDHYFQE